MLSPLIAPVFLTPALPDEACAALILTSETGAEAAGRIRARLPDLAYCVGDRTAEVAQEAGFATRNAKGDATALTDLILSQPRSPLLHLRGREARGDFAASLAPHGIAVHERIVYVQEEQALSDEAAALLVGAQPVLAPVFSPRSARILVSECQRIGARAPVSVIAMSEAVARAAVGLGSKPARLALRPDGESMLEAVIAEWVAGQGA